jgi:hypothetical protein
LKDSFLLYFWQDFDSYAGVVAGKLDLAKAALATGLEDPIMASEKVSPQPASLLPPHLFTTNSQ